jgi:hypothetical protein
VEYFQNKEVAACTLSWEKEDGKKEVVPPSAYFHKADRELDAK